jgi:hypothetical protein
MKEKLSDKHKVVPGEKFEQVWTFKNDGTHSWPENTVFTFSAGDNLSYDEVKIGSLKIGEVKEISLTLTAPQKVGNYASFFRLGYQSENEYKKFGHQVWCDFVVEEPAQIVPIDDGLSRKEELLKDLSAPDRDLFNNLMEMGFTNVELNVKLIKKFKDPETIVKKLMDEKVSISELN